MQKPSSSVSSGNISPAIVGPSKDTKEVYATVPGGPLRYRVIAETVERMAEDKPARLARKAGWAR